MKIKVSFGSVCCVAMLGLMLACESSPEQKSQPEHLEVEKVVFEREACAGDTSSCATVDITYPAFSGGELGMAEWVNLHVKEQLLMYFHWGDEAPASDSLEMEAGKFLKEYTDFAKEYPGSAMPWFHQTSAEVSHLDKSLISIHFANSSFTGGAHPNHSVMYVNIDPENQKVLTNEELILDREALLEIAEKSFRQYHEVAPDQSLEEDGRFFLDEKGQFFLPAALGYEGDDFVMVYNSYEIGPYSMGQTELRFPVSDLKGMVRAVYKE